MEETSFEKTKIEEIPSLSYLLFDCSTTKIGPSLSRQCHSPNVNHYFYSSFDSKLPTAKIGPSLSRQCHSPNVNHSFYSSFDSKVTRGHHINLNCL